MALSSYEQAMFYIERDNLAREQAQFDYSRRLQRQIFEREDTAIQRRVADLEAAGLNPVLAAGQGARAGNVVSTKAPQRGVQSYAQALERQRMQLQAISDITRTFAETQLIESQVRKTNAEARKMEGSYVPDIQQTVLENQRLKSTMDATIRRAEGEADLVYSRADTEEARRANIRLQNEYLYKTMDVRVGSAARANQKLGLDITYQEIVNEMKGIESERYQQLYEFIQHETQKREVLMEPEAIDLLTAYMMKQAREKDIEWHHDANLRGEAFLPYSGKGANMWSLVLESIRELIGGLSGNSSSGQGRGSHNPDSDYPDPSFSGGEYGDGWQ